MLIKFLSFVASAILGSSRHKAVIVSCSTVALAIAGVIGLTMYHNGQPSDAASTTASSNERAGQEDTIWLQAHEVDSKDQYAAQTEAENLPAQPADEPGEQGDHKLANDPSELSEQTISLSSSEITLTPDSTSDVILAHISGATAAANWTISAAAADAGENSDNIGLSVTSIEKTGDQATFRISVSKDALPGTYYVTVQAAFAESNMLPLSKTIEVTVQAAQ
jgi:hypothetical protein